MDILLLGLAVVGLIVVLVSRAIPRLEAHVEQLFEDIW